MYDSLTHIRTLLRQAPDKDITGGRIYDVVIAACVLKRKPQYYSPLTRAISYPLWREEWRLLSLERVGYEGLIYGRR